MLLVEQFPVLNTLDIDVPEGNEVGGELRCRADERKLIGCLPRSGTLDVKTRDAGVVDQGLRVLDVLRDALGRGVVLVEEKGYRGSRDDTHLCQDTLDLNRPQPIDAAIGQVVISHLGPASNVVRFRNAKFCVRLGRDVLLTFLLKLQAGILTDGRVPRCEANATQFP